MSPSTITIIAANEVAIPEIVDLILAQQARQFARDSHLAPGERRADVERSFKEQIPYAPT